MDGDEQVGTLTCCAGICAGGRTCARPKLMFPRGYRFVIYMFSWVIDLVRPIEGRFVMYRFSVCACP